MTNDAKQRKNFDKRSRPKSWCVPSSRVDLNPAVTKNIHGFSKQALWHGDKYEDTLNNVNHEFSYRKFSYNNNSRMTNKVIDHHDSLPRNTHGNISNARCDDNNNFSSDKIRYTEKHPKVIRRNNVDKTSRRAVVSLNLSKDYSSYVDQCAPYRPKKNRPKSLYQNIFRRSCNLLKFHVFGDNSKHERLGASFTSTQRSLDSFRENTEMPSGGMSSVLQEHNSILTDGESCFFSGDVNDICLPKCSTPLTGNDVSQLKWNLWRSNDDVCQGVSVGTGESIYDNVGDINHTEAYISNLMPWTKRALSMPDNEDLPNEQFQCRRDNRKYSSLRSPTSKSKGGTPPNLSPCGSEHSSYHQQKFFPSKRHSNENIRLNRAGSARFYRPNSMDTTLRRKTINFTTQDRFINDNMKILNQKTMRNKKGEGRNAPNFFIRYQDVLREEKITATPPIYYDSSKFTQINEVFEYLLNLHCTKPVNKTCKQLFYIRSRLSKNARLNDSMCDGCFGCGRECFTITTR